MGVNPAEAVFEEVDDLSKEEDRHPDPVPAPQESDAEYWQAIAQSSKEWFKDI